MRRQAAGALLAALVVLSAVAPAAAAASIAYDASAAPNAEIATDVTVASHDMSTMSPLEYEDDSGEVATLPAEVNTSTDVDDLGTGTVNAYSYTPTSVEFADASAFPRNKAEVSAVDNESEWSTGTGISVADVETAPGVEATEFATNGSFSAGDSATATFNNFSVTSDVEKRYLQVGLTVDTLDADAILEVRAVDSDGDVVIAEVNASRSSGEDFIANATGDGYVYQRQIGQMTVEGNGDGTMQEIQKIEIRAVDADSTVHVMALNVEKTSPWTLGDEYVNTDTSDDDDDLETNTIQEHKTAGSISVHSLDTLGSTFDDAVIHDVTYPVNFRVADLADEDDMNVTFSDASSYPAFAHKLEAYFRIQLPDAYDLSYANAQLQDEVAVPSGRYETVEYKEGVGDTDFSDLDSWSSVKSSYSSEGADVTLDNTIQPGQEIAIHYVYPVTDDERDALEATGVAGGPIGGSGGPADWPVIGTVLAGLGGLWAWVTGRLPF